MEITYRPDALSVRTVLIAAGAAGRVQFWNLEKGETFLYLYSFCTEAWLASSPDGRFNATPEGMRYLCYVEKEGFNLFTAEELVKEFYDPKAVEDVVEKYIM